jgi:hypothetical protein
MPDLLNGINVIKGISFLPVDSDIHFKKTIDFIAIPYYAWAHRGPGEMAVWFRIYTGS